MPKHFRSARLCGHAAWHAEQKCVVPKQKKVAAEQQKLANQGVWGR